ncbi:MAG: SUMF1/EgtB/PvdO family nonheme iron enzyme [Solirubrobacteraceae bacterium]
MVWVKNGFNSFYIDETEVTNKKFHQFVKATRYVTTAEKDFILTNQLGKKIKQKKGSLVFYQPKNRVAANPTSWWVFIEGADWRHPLGPNSSIKGLENHPAVHISWEDANSYATFYGKRLPTIEEWEVAAISKKHQQQTGNIWQGIFPYLNSLKDGFLNTAPVRSFNPNDKGIYDLSGNVWEWCKEGNPDNKNEAAIKGGSFLCNNSYCTAYKNLTTRFADKKSSFQHIGFRCVAN